MHWSCRRRTSTQNTWQWIKYFNLHFDGYEFVFLFFHISEKYLQFTKKRKVLLRKVFGSPHTGNQIYLLRSCFQNMCILKKCT